MTKKKDNKFGELDVYSSSMHKVDGKQERADIEEAEFESDTVSMGHNFRDPNGDRIPPIKDSNWELMDHDGTINAVGTL